MQTISKLKFAEVGSCLESYNSYPGELIVYDLNLRELRVNDEKIPMPLEELESHCRSHYPELVKGQMKWGKVAPNKVHRIISRRCNSSRFRCPKMSYPMALMENEKQGYTGVSSKAAAMALHPLDALEFYHLLPVAVDETERRYRQLKCQIDLCKAEGNADHLAGYEAYPGYTAAYVICEKFENLKGDIINDIQKESLTAPDYLKPLYDLALASLAFNLTQEQLTKEEIQLVRSNLHNLIQQGDFIPYAFCLELQYQLTRKDSNQEELFVLLPWATEIAKEALFNKPRSLVLYPMFIKAYQKMDSKFCSEVCLKLCQLQLAIAESPKESLAALVQFIAFQGNLVNDEFKVPDCVLVKLIQSALNGTPVYWPEGSIAIRPLKVALDDEQAKILVELAFKIIKIDTISTATISDFTK